MQTLVAENEELRRTIERLEMELAQAAARHQDDLAAVRQQLALTEAEATRSLPTSVSVRALEERIRQLEASLHSSDAKHAVQVQVARSPCV